VGNPSYISLRTSDLLLHLLSLSYFHPINCFFYYRTKEKAIQHHAVWIAFSSDSRIICLRRLQNCIYRLIHLFFHDLSRLILKPPALFPLLALITQLSLPRLMTHQSCLELPRSPNPSHPTMHYPFPLLFDGIISLPLFPVLGNQYIP